MQRLVIVIVLTASCGCLDPSAFQSKKPDDAAAPVPPQAAAPAPAVGAAPAAAPAPVPQGENAIPDVEAVIVDKPKALAVNPNLVETSNKINATDPLSAVSQSYFALGARVQLLNFQNNIKIFQAAEGRYPTYDELIDMFRQFDVKLKSLKAYQVYAYDQSDGTICILEDRAEKKRRYEAAGIEYTE